MPGSLWRPAGETLHLFFFKILENNKTIVFLEVMRKRIHIPYTL